MVSARVIPGNEADVEKVLSKLRSRGVEVLTAAGATGQGPVHVSGHAGRLELMKMHALARPRFALPVHGEPAHLAAHAEIAMACGAEAAPITSEGEVLTVSPSGVRSLGRLTVPVLHLGDDERGNRAPLPGPLMTRAAGTEGRERRAMAA